MSIQTSCALCTGSSSNRKSLLTSFRTHSAQFRCGECKHSYFSDAALQKHWEYRPTHAQALVSGLCDRHDVNRKAPNQREETLQSHRADKDQHAISFECTRCKMSFAHTKALKQHLRYSTAHAPQHGSHTASSSSQGKASPEKDKHNVSGHAKTYHCELCARPFKNRKALAAHKRDSPRHATQTQTPLDAFFRSFPTFQYEPSLPPATSYARLRSHEHLEYGSPESDDAWDRYQRALEGELSLWFGAEDGLEAWHALCKAVGIKPLPNTIERCAKAVRSTHVNIVDLIEWGRERSENKVPVVVFSSVEALAKYTRRTGKYYTRDNDSDNDSDNVVIRHLLRKLLRQRLGV